MGQDLVPPERNLPVPQGSPLAVTGQGQDSTPIPDLDPNNIYKTLTDSIWEGAYMGILPGSRDQLHRSEEVQQSYLDAQNEIWQAVVDGLSTDAEGSDSRAASDAARAAARSLSGFFQGEMLLLEDQYNRRLGQRGTLGLARDSARDIHARRSTAAQQLGTAGERYEAQIRADQELAERLSDISDLWSEFTDQTHQDAQDARAQRQKQIDAQLEANALYRRVNAEALDRTQADVRSLILQGAAGDAFRRDEGDINARFDAELATQLRAYEDPTIDYSRATLAANRESIRQRRETALDNLLNLYNTPGNVAPFDDPNTGGSSSPRAVVNNYFNFEGSYHSDRSLLDTIQLGFDRGQVTVPN